MNDRNSILIRDSHPRSILGDKKLKEKEKKYAMKKIGSRCSLRPQLL